LSAELTKNVFLPTGYQLKLCKTIFNINIYPLDSSLLVYTVIIETPCFYTCITNISISLRIGKLFFLLVFTCLPAYL